MSGNLSSSGSEPSIAPAPSGGRWRALCRLVAVALHIVRGLCIVYLRLPGMSRQQRHAQVQQWSAELVRRCGVSLQVCGQLASPSSDPLFGQQVLGQNSKSVAHGGGIFVNR